MAQLTLTMVHIDKIVAHPKNARKHPAKQLKQLEKSIEAFGNNMPIIIDEMALPFPFFLRLLEPLEILDHGSIASVEPAPCDHVEFAVSRQVVSRKADRATVLSRDHVLLEVGGFVPGDHLFGR